MRGVLELRKLRAVRRTALIFEKREFEEGGERVDPKQPVTFEELLRACIYEQEALRRVLVRKGLLTNEEVLEEVKVVRVNWTVK